MEDDCSRQSSGNTVVEADMIPVTVQAVQPQGSPCIVDSTVLEDSQETEEEDILNSSLTPMDWLPRLNARAGVIEEEPSPDERKPPYSYATLIRLAILNSEGQKATLSDIYRWIQDEFTYYRQLKNPGWKNSIRHNLSLNKSFLKMARTRQDPGKGCYWTLNPLFSKQHVLDKKKRSMIDLVDTSMMPDLKQIQEEHIRQWKLILSEQISNIQAVTPSEPIYLPIHQREESMSGLMLDDWLTNCPTELSLPTEEEVSENKLFTSQLPGAIGQINQSEGSATGGLDWNYLEGLQTTDVSDVLKLRKDGTPIKEELSVPETGWTSGGTDIFRCVDPSAVMDQQRLPSLWSTTKNSLDSDWREVPDFVDDDISIDYDKLL